MGEVEQLTSECLKSSLEAFDRFDLRRTLTSCLGILSGILLYGECLIGDILTEGDQRAAQAAYCALIPHLFVLGKIRTI